MICISISFLHKPCQLILTEEKCKATSNKFLDSHPNFVKNGGGWEIFIFHFSDCFEEQINAGRHIEYLEIKLSNRIK